MMLTNRLPRVISAAKNVRAFHSAAPLRATRHGDDWERSREEEAAYKHDMELIRKMLNRTVEEQTKSTTVHIQRSSDELKKEVKETLMAQQVEDQKKIQELQSKMEEMKQMLEKLVNKK